MSTPTINGHPRAAVASMIALLALAGCGSSGDSAEAGTPRTMTEFRQWTQTRAAERERAVHSLVTECMGEAGFDYAAPAPDDGAAATSSPGATISARISAWAATQPADAAAAREEAVDQIAVQSNEYYEALGAPGEGGCIADAESVVGADILPPEILRLLDAAFRDVGDDPRLGAALQSWASCLGDRGHAVDTSDGGDVARLVEVEALALFSARGYPSASVDDALLAAPPDQAVAVANELAPVEEALVAANDQCLDESGVEEIQDEWLSLALADVPAEFFTLDS